MAQVLEQLLRTCPGIRRVYVIVRAKRGCAGNLPYPPMLAPIDIDAAPSTHLAGGVCSLYKPVQVCWGLAKLED